jgi:hypothetical protein
MFRLIQNPKVRGAIAVGASFSYGHLVMGTFLRDSVSPIGVLLISLAAMPLLGLGFYFQLTAIARQFASRENTDTPVE